MRFRRRPAAIPQADGADLVLRYWEVHDEEFMSAGLGTMARRLPALTIARRTRRVAGHPLDTSSRSG